MRSSVLCWDEKRQYQRIPATAEVWVRNVSAFTSPSLFHIGTRCALRDLSFGGVRLLSDQGFASVGDQLEITLPKLNGKMTLVGTLVRRTDAPSGDDIALRFNYLPIAEQVTLTRTLFDLASALPVRQRNRPLSPIRIKKLHSKDQDRATRH